MSLELMQARMNAIGGATNDDRINDGKLKSLRSAMRNSYQAEWIQYKDNTCRCLINPVKLSTDYDQKEISIEFKDNMAVGQYFYWTRTDTWWIVLNQRLTEEAYFRGEIRKCNYEIQAEVNTYRIALRGPVETALVWNQKHQIQFNDMNYSLMFYITKNAETDAFFTRHRIVKFDGHNWKVAATDRYSQENIIEVYLEEAHDNEMQDAQEIPEIEKIDVTTTYIDGNQIVSPYDTDVKYRIINKTTAGTWKTKSSKVKITSSDEDSCMVDVITGRSGSFTLQYILDNDEVAASLDVVIKSL